MGGFWRSMVLEFLRSMVLEIQGRRFMTHLVRVGHNKGCGSGKEKAIFYAKLGNRAINVLKE